MSNKEYTKYDPVSGAITQVGSCSAKKLSLLTDYIMGHYDAELYYIVDGKAIAKPQTVLDARKLVIDNSKSMNKRNALLNDSDKYMLPDFPTSLGAEWLAYRQELRDLPDHADWPYADFPTQPK